ncbi:MAG: hypothetical protein SOW90_00595 [Gallibacter sp.]|nr:hypothetical protein [Gallibacter sp.]
MFMRICGIRKYLFAVLLLLIGAVIFTSCGDRAQLGVISDDSQANLPSAKSMELNLNLKNVENQDIKLITEPIAEDIDYQLGEYNITKDIKSVSLISFKYVNGKWTKNELAKDNYLEYDKPIKFFLGTFKSNDQILFSTATTLKDKDFPGGKYKDDSKISYSNAPTVLLTEGYQKISKNQFIPLIIKLSGTQASIEKVRNKMQESFNTNRPMNELNYFVENPKELINNNIQYQFIGIEFN